MAAPSSRREQLHGPILIEGEAIYSRVNQLAVQVLEKYPDPPLFLIVLKGGVPFSQLIFNALEDLEPGYNPAYDYVSIKTYAKGQRAGKPRITKGLDPDTEIAGLDVVGMDDIDDSGGTRRHLKKYAMRKGASSYEHLVLTGRENSEAEMIGFRLSGAWVVGLGLDGPGAPPGGGRTLPYIAECLVQPENH